MSNPNYRRAVEGQSSVLVCADIGEVDIDTACSDAIANILHFVCACGLDPWDVVERAQRCYQGDSEDGPAKRIVSPELFGAEAVEHLRRRAQEIKTSQ
jgi:hypothetical protein